MQFIKKDPQNNVDKKNLWIYKLLFLMAKRLDQTLISTILLN